MALAIAGVTGIAVNGQREFDGHIQTGGVGYKYRTASQVVGHIAAHVDVVAVIVLAILGAVHLVRHACPLGVVACGFEAAGQSAHTATTIDVTHTAAKTYGIGCYHTVVVATQVAERYAVACALTLVEIKSAQVNPCFLAHRLVHTELGGDALVPYGIVGIVDALIGGVIAHINGVITALGDGGFPDDFALALDVIGSGRLATSTCGERIFEVFITT